MDLVLHTKHYFCRWFLSYFNLLAVPEEEWNNIFLPCASDMCYQSLIFFFPSFLCFCRLVNEKKSRKQGKKEKRNPSVASWTYTIFSYFVIYFFPLFLLQRFQCHCTYAYYIGPLLLLWFHTKVYLILSQGERFTFLAWEFLQMDQLQRRQIRNTGESSIHTNMNEWWNSLLLHSYNLPFLPAIFSAYLSITFSQTKAPSK